MTRLETKLVEIRAYRMNWESYQQGEVISKSDYQFISHYSQQNSQEREKLFQQDPEQVSCGTNLRFINLNLYLQLYSKSCLKKNLISILTAQKSIP